MSKVVASLTRMRGRGGLRLPEGEILDLAEQIHRRFPNENGVAAALLSIDMQQLVEREQVEATIDLIVQENAKRPKKPYWRGDGWDPAWVRRDPRWFGRADSWEPAMIRPDPRWIVRPSRWYVPVGNGRWLNSPVRGCGPLRFSGTADRVNRISMDMSCEPRNFATVLKKFHSEVRVAGAIIWPDSNPDAAALANHCTGPIEIAQEMRGRLFNLAITDRLSPSALEPDQHYFRLEVKPITAS